jgi:hypothetical protein
MGCTVILCRRADGVGLEAESGGRVPTWHPAFLVGTVHGTEQAICLGDTLDRALEVVATNPGRSRNESITLQRSD